jgi:acetyl-CoA C-acetyltransferase
MMEGEREVPKTAARRRTKSAAPAAGLRPVYIVDGARTPFLRARGKPGPFTPVDLAVQCARHASSMPQSVLR